VYNHQLQTICSILRTVPPSSFACLMISQKGETYLVADSRNRLMPRYGCFWNFLTFC
jgi:hypothetical protein